MTDDDALIARLRDNIGIGRDGRLLLTDEHVRTMREAADRLEALNRKLNEPINGTYSINQLVERVAQAEIERDEAKNKVRQLRIIANVNGDWNIKYGEAINRADMWEERAARMQRERDALRELANAAYRKDYVQAAIDAALKAQTSPQSPSPE